MSKYFMYDSELQELEQLMMLVPNFLPTLKLSIGKAFDLAFEYNEVDRKKAAGFEHYTYECIIRNHKNTEAEISFMKQI